MAFSLAARGLDAGEELGEDVVVRGDAVAPHQPGPEGRRAGKALDVRGRVLAHLPNGDVLPLEFGQQPQVPAGHLHPLGSSGLDRKSTRLNSSHVKISYAV